MNQRYKLVYRIEGEPDTTFTINISKHIFESWFSRLNAFAKDIGLKDCWKITIIELTRIY